ncbi:MAG: hypothetical protein ACXAC5_04980 [Promethearchaeota archaeon]|jgi:hypothetical protein
MAQRDLEKYKRLLRILLQLEAKSDRIRDEMDEPWYNMTKEEQEEIERITKEYRKEFGIE